MIGKLVGIFSKRSREKRAHIFLDYMGPSEEDKILDLGSEDGSYMASIIPFRKNVFIADIDLKMLLRGKNKYGFQTVVIEEDGALPFEDNYFDIVHCSSVIEHVGIDKSEMWDVKDGVAFAKQSFQRQQKFANEIRRIAKRYFIQTPNKNFAIESHTWLPFVQFLPRSVLISFIKWLNKWWIKKTSPDWHLLKCKQMQMLFPDADIVKENIGFLCKSIIAVKAKQD